MSLPTKPTHAPALAGWAQQAWEPFRGCTEISSGCDNCFARNYAALNAGPGANWDGVAGWKGKRTDEVFRTYQEAGAGARPVWIRTQENLNAWNTAPGHWQPGARVQVCRFSDAFHPNHGREAIERMLEYCAWHSRYRFFISTRQWGSAVRSLEHRGPRSLANVAVGFSAHNQPSLDNAWQYLARLDAPEVRWLNLEPLLGPVNLSAVLAYTDRPRRRNRGPAIDWLTIGLETGRKARDGVLEHVESAVQQAQAAGVRVYVTQLGSRPIHKGASVSFRQMRGSDPTEWPEHLRLRELPPGWER